MTKSNIYQSQRGADSYAVIHLKDNGPETTETFVFDEGEKYELTE